MKVLENTVIVAHMHFEMEETDTVNAYVSSPVKHINVKIGDRVTLTMTDDQGRALVEKILSSLHQPGRAG